MYSSIFTLTSGRESLGDVSSMTKSGQIGANFRRCSGFRASHRAFRIQAESGDRSAPLGRMNPVEESNPTPVPSRMTHAANNPFRLKFRCPVSLPAGGMMISSPSRVRSILRSLFSPQNSNNSSSVSGTSGRHRSGRRSKGVTIGTVTKTGLFFGTTTTTASVAVNRSRTTGAPGSPRSRLRSGAVLRAPAVGRRCRCSPARRLRLALARGGSSRC